MHQEIGWERSTANSNMAVLVYADKIDNPVMQAMSRPAQGNTFAGGAVLYDPESGMLRAGGPGFSSAGMLAVVERNLPRGARVQVSCANGTALVLAGSPQQPGLAQLIASAHARHAQTYSISLSGTLDGSGTRWRATYRWQPEATITPVAAFAEDAAAPYLNLQLRQPIHIGRDGSSGFEALVNLNNLLAQGYRPYVLSDGSLLVFAADQRSFGGGVAFNF
jgi:hypothetical protein